MTIQIQAQANGVVLSWWYWLFEWGSVRCEELCRSRSQSETNFEWKILSFKLNFEKTGNKNWTCNLCCNINAKRNEKRCCAFYHSRLNLLTTWFVSRQVLCGWWNAQHRYSTRFTAILQDKLHVFCCPFFHTFSSFLWLVCYAKKRTLRSSNAPLIEISLVKGTFQDSWATLFNTLPASVRRCADFNTFKNNCLTYLKSRANMRLSLTS